MINTLFSEFITLTRYGRANEVGNALGEEEQAIAGGQPIQANQFHQQYSGQGIVGRDEESVKPGVAGHARVVRHNRHKDGNESRRRSQRRVQIEGVYRRSIAQIANHYLTHCAHYACKGERYLYD